MRKSKVLELINTFFEVRKIKESSGWININCPLAPYTHADGVDKHPSFGISFGSGISTYYCFACGIKGNIKRLPSELARYQGEYNYNLSDFITDAEEIVFIPEETQKEKYKPLDIRILDMFIPYTGDMFSSKIKKKYYLKYDPKERRLIFPIFDFNGDLAGVRGRYLGKDSFTLRYREYSEFGSSIKKSGIWYGMHEPIIDDILFLVEGEKDMLAVKSIRPDVSVWASMGQASLAQMKIFSKLSPCTIVLFFDNDNSGQEWTERFAEFLHKRHKVVVMPEYFGCKDAFDMFQNKSLAKGLTKALHLC